MPFKVLAVDDNADGLFALQELLTSNGYDVITASSGKETLEKAEKEVPDVILLDVVMPAPNGYEVAKILKAHPVLKYSTVVLLTGKDELKDILFGLEQGADDYICKPYQKDELLARVSAVLRTRKLYDELRQTRTEKRELQARFSSSKAFGSLIGKSKAMQELYSVMARVIESDVPVLISGESGTGKELVARAIHSEGSRAGKSFVVQNCSAFNDNLLESELFGHVRGAFTGAIRDKDGLFKVADKGTFFLDELGEMSPALQVKLLRVLQSGTFMPVGGTREERVDVRVVAATHRDIDDMVQKGTFREDLYYRLNVINIKLPPLRDRAGDVPLLVAFFLKDNAERSGAPEKEVSAEAMRALESFDWPGNIRQLENEIQRATVMSAKEPIILLEHLSDKVRGGAGSVARADAGQESVPSGKLKDALEHLERRMIESALSRTANNKSEAARQLGISRSNLISKAQGYGLADGEE